ncbi:hypothetical protein A2671_00675 [Candidatus Kaiserbacteria bacterium RIFCSPHIGHO2_01_FULL_49_13]|uniref:Glycine zipper domain-containing protein n=1 Tax=Candidatus Kaiserbacteria bacterium RIFCSPHIGHO2_01_FULL_49_13 TaxID=1798477 RepID=A0A1F6CEZ3_9BACT|nr:MAG: hypothetical protein A2671_00675 [Candidatus Kaiserbacteria bacterium RIFCSPHIGHO2_01_FULL_49_13]
MKFIKLMPILALTLLLGACGQKYRGEMVYTAAGGAAGGLTCAAMGASGPVIGLCSILGLAVGNAVGQALEPEIVQPQPTQVLYAHPIDPPYECYETRSRASGPGYGGGGNFSIFGGGGGYDRSEQCSRRTYRY